MTQEIALFIFFILAIILVFATGYIIGQRNARYDKEHMKKNGSEKTNG